VCGPVEGRTGSVERLILYVADGFRFAAVVVGRLTGLAVATDAYNAGAFGRSVVASDLDKVLSACGNLDSDFRLLTLEIVVALDQVAGARIAGASVVDRQLRVEAGAGQTYGCSAGARGGVAVPYVRADHKVPRAVLSCC